MTRGISRCGSTIHSLLGSQSFFPSVASVEFLLEILTDKEMGTVKWTQLLAFTSQVGDRLNAVRTSFPQMRQMKSYSSS